MSDAPALQDFLDAYGKFRNMDAAQAWSGYVLEDKYPPSGFYVYALIDPRTREIFYIGKGIGGRILKHEERTRRGVVQNMKKTERIQEILSQNFEVMRRILFISESEEAALAMEDHAIRKLAPYGLTNIIGGFSTRTPRVVELASSLRAKIHHFHEELAKA